MHQESISTRRRRSSTAAARKRLQQPINNRLQQPINNRLQQPVEFFPDNEMDEDAKEFFASSVSLREETEQVMMLQHDPLTLQRLASLLLTPIPSTLNDMD